MVTMKNYLTAVSGEELLKNLNEFSPDTINNQPFTEKELLDRYVKYTDPLLTHVRLMTEDNVFVLGNEVRALFGHLADYRLNQKKRKNLSDAYGHFRRINIDAFKMICDRLDEFLFQYLKQHYHYDYRNVNQNFLSQYTEKYFSAQRSYMDAQVHERAGSDRLSGNIIDEYYWAAKRYVELFVYLQNNCSGLECAKRNKQIRIIAATAILVFTVVQGVIAS